MRRVVLPLAGVLYAVTMGVAATEAWRWVLAWPRAVDEVTVSLECLVPSSQPPLTFIGPTSECLGLTASPVRATDYLTEYVRTSEYWASDGAQTLYFVESWNSPAAATRALHARVEGRAYAQRFGDLNSCVGGEVVRERVVVPGNLSRFPAAAVLWTVGSDFHYVLGSSVKHAPALEAHLLEQPE